ncbi:MAG: ABC transporter permease [Chloroflexi bacterium]|nr:ABC transporter permease [Chloroflexota bacterium]MBV9132419.1 ABC transporter permease [Chloroflexota bacterium]MBV9898405.1 ABC transporter permease [Chloroflexota bacterium]
MAVIELLAPLEQRDEIGAIRPRSYYREVGERLRGDPVALGSLAVVVVIFGSAIGAPLLTTYDPLQGSILARLLPVGSDSHILGTDEQGRDMLARLLYGGQLSLFAGIAPVVISTAIGTIIGAVAAYFGGVVETLLMRAMDVSYAFPALLLAIGIAAALGPGLTSTIVAITIVLIPPVSRVALSATRQVVVQEYVEAASVAGASPRQIIQYQLLPNIASPIFVYTSGLIGLAIVSASGLSFLGLGSAPPAPEWGAMLNTMRGSVYVAPDVVALPGLMIFVTSVAFNVLSDCLRDALDVKSV